MWPNVFKTVSFSSYFHLSYYLFSQILCYTNSLTFQDLLFSKNYITDNAPGKFDDNRPRSTPSLLFYKSMDLSMSLGDHFYFNSFSKNSITTSSVSSFSFTFTPWMRRQFLLEYCSWRSIRYILELRFLAPKIVALSPFYPPPCPKISHKWTLVTSSMCLVPLIWASFVGEESSKVSFTCFSKFCEQLYEIPTQRGDSIPSSKISGSSLLSDVFKLLSLSLAFFLSSSSFGLSLKSRFCLSKNFW